MRSKKKYVDSIPLLQTAKFNGVRFKNTLFIFSSFKLLDCT